MKAGDREKLRQWIVKKRTEGRSGAGRALGVRIMMWGCVQKGSGNGCLFPFFISISQILERSALKKIQAFHLKKGKLSLSDRVTKREN